MSGPQRRVSNADRALALVEWGMDKQHRDKHFTKQQLATALGMGVGTGFDRVCSAARELCNERGWNFSYFQPLTNGTWVASFTKRNAKLPLPGVLVRSQAINAQSANVRKQMIFVRDHSGNDSVLRHITKIVEQAEANQIEVNALLRAVLDHISDEND